MQKQKRIVALVLCMGLVLIGVFYFGCRSEKYYFAGIEVRDATIRDSVSECMLRYSERKALSKILHNMRMQKGELNVQEMLLYSSRAFWVETKDVVYEIRLYGKVGEDYLCAVNQERYRVTENVYRELDKLYDACFRNAHGELFEGFQNSKIVRIASGIGYQEKEFSESEIEEVVTILQSMSVLGKAEENPSSLFYGMNSLSVKTEKDLFVIGDIVSCGDEGTTCFFNGSNYWIDKESGEKLAKIIY